MLMIPILFGFLLLAGWLTGRGRQLREMSAIFLFCTAVGRPCVIPTGSMETTIHGWDWVWLSHLPHSVQRGDVVCFPGPDGDKLYCKRVVGLGGDQLEMRDGHLRLNGKPVDEPWAESTHENWGPIQVAPGRLFVMGDHRSNSFDSRYWGTVPKDFVTGTAVVVAFPPHHWRKL